MSLVRKEPLHSDEHYVRISKEEAINLQWQTVFDWKPHSEVWPFRYGISGLGISAAISSLYILGYYRRKLKLRSHARIVMNFPVAALPTIILPILHQKFVAEPILIQSTCPVCIQMRSILLQNAVGVLYPMILAPLSGFMYSSMFLTYPLPLLKVGNIPELLSIWKKMTLPFTKKLPTLFLINSALAAFVTEFEAQSFFSMQEKILSDVKR